MSTRIKLTRNVGGHKAGDTIETTPKAADYLISNDYAETVKGRPAKKADDTED